MKFLIPLLLFSLFLPSLHAQRKPAWKAKYDQGHYYEGTYSRQVGNPSVELISLTAGRVAYEFGKKQTLTVRWHSPGPSAYQLHAEDISGTRFYWFEDTSTMMKQGENILTGWAVDGWLRKLQLTHYNVGLLLRYGESGSRKFLPVQSYLGSSPSEPSRYVAILRLGRAISSGDWAVYRGTSARGKPLINQAISRKSGGSYFALRMPANDLPQAGGWVKVVLNFRERGTLDPFTYSFTYYVPARS